MTSSVDVDAHALRVALSHDPKSSDHPTIVAHTAVHAGAGLHLAVMTGPYLNLIIDGTKTVESRFHKVRSAPLHTVSAGDLVAFKPSGRPVSHVASVHRVTYIDLTQTSLEAVRGEWQRMIAATTDDFWSAKADARWVSLIELERMREIEPVKLLKRDRRGWVTYPPCCTSYTLFST